MKMKTFSMIFLSLFAMSNLAFAKQKWYHVEILIFENQDKDSQELSIDPGKPLLSNAARLVGDPLAEFGQLSESALVLQKAKRRLQKNYHLVLHKAWRQTITDKEHAQKVHLLGGQNLSNVLHMPGTYEVDGTVLLSLGRHIYLDADLLLQKPISYSQKVQSVRLTETSRIKPDEITYIDHPSYGILVIVIPEKSIAQKRSLIEEKTKKRSA